MKKFTQINNDGKSVEKSTNRQEFIENLIEESLSIENGEIIGKDSLIKTLNHILDINDSKTTINVLESVKHISFQNLDFNWINETIEIEKSKMNKPLAVEEVSEGVEETQELELINESNKSEGKTIEEEDDDKTINDVEEEENKEEVEGFDVETLFVKEGINYVNEDYMDDINGLSKIMESIDNGEINEHHITDTKDRVDFILGKMDNDETARVIVDMVSTLSDYKKDADVEKTLRKASDKEVEDIYLKVEEVENITESVEDTYTNIDSEEFYEFYTPLKNHLDTRATLEGCMFETYGDEFEFVKAMNMDNKVWTVNEGKDGEIIYTSKMNTKKPLGYFITNNSHNGEDVRFISNNE